MLEETLTRCKEQLGPEHPATHLSLSNLAGVFIKADDQDKALSLLLANHSGEQAYYKLGNLLGNVGKRREAVAAYREAIRINPDYFEATQQFGDCTGVRGKRRGRG